MSDIQDFLSEADFDAPPMDGPGPEHIREAEAIEEQLADNPALALQLAEEALAGDPTDGTHLILAAMAAVRKEDPKAALRYIKRLQKWYVASPADLAAHAIALAQEERWPVAQQLVRKHELRALPPAFLFPRTIATWGGTWLRRIERWQPRPVARAPRNSRVRPKSSAHAPRPPAAHADASPQAAPPPLPRFAPRVALNFKLPAVAAFAALDGAADGSIEDFLLKQDLSRLSLFRGFDELLCIPHLRGVEHYWYQVETVRKVLRLFRGRVLLADEVGLGKTVEAGMVLKEYILRGMVERVLVLTPPSLVEQWREEMETKFDIACSTTHSSRLRRDPAEFWSQPRIIASIATARLARHAEHLSRQAFDIVIVDEAHHLKSRATRNWKLVDALKKRFLLMLSATPVQNNLIELYTLLTLLKPGLFKTEREFRAAHVDPRHPRRPVNREQLQNLMRDAMIRNTRALVDVRLPPRQVITLRVDPRPEEAAAYEALSDLIRTVSRDPAAHRRMALHHLLQAAGSSPMAAAAALERLLARGDDEAWRPVHGQYAALAGTAKVGALLDLLDRNPTEKKLVFVRRRETLRMLDSLLTERGIAFACFDGSLSGPQKDEAVERFRDRATVLLCTESGGEGRNLQFCNTLINFDLHWNPQRIEQRIGRIHRIGQEREVFVFNLALRHTIEDRLLSILDEKINMFELVVGEVQAVLGEMEDRHDFSEMVFAAWVHETEAQRDAAFEQIGDKLLEAREQHDAVKAYDEELFGDEFEVV